MSAPWQREFGELLDAKQELARLRAKCSDQNQEIARLWRLIDERCEECGQKITRQTGFVLDDDDWLFCSEECRDRARRRHERVP